MAVSIGMRGGVLVAALVCVSLAAYVPVVAAQAVVRIETAFYLPQGFFIRSALDNGVLGANTSLGIQSTKSLTGGVLYPAALVNTEFYLFNLTYNRGLPGPSVPPNFGWTEFFEINLLSTLPTEFREWNAWGYGTNIDLWQVRAGTAEPNALFSFELVDQANNFYIIHGKLNSSYCVSNVGQGIDFVLVLCDASSPAQRFQFIDAFIPNAPIPLPGTAVDVSTAYYLPRGFFISNVLDDAILGANTTWQLSAAVAYATAITNTQFHLFNLTYNRTDNTGTVPSTFDSSQYFEINLLGTLSSKDGFKQWNVWSYIDQVDLYPLGKPKSGQNALFSFDLVDPVRFVYVIRAKMDANKCVTTTSGGVDFVLKACQPGNTAFRFQLINPSFPDSSSSSDSSNFFSTAGGVIVILVIIGVALGAAYGGWRYYQKYYQNTKSHKASTSNAGLSASLNSNGAEVEEGHGNYRKIGDNMELGSDGNGHTSGRASTRGASPNDDY